MRPNGSEGRVRSGKSLHVMLCCLPQLLFILLGLGVYFRGYWLLLPVVFLLLVVPLLDTVTGWQDTIALPKEAFSRADIFLLHWNTRVYVVLYMAAVVLILRFLNQFTVAERAFLLASCGLIAAVGFAAVHEILHCRGKLDQMLQKIVTAFLFYPHYKLIHAQSHHALVGTVADKNTAWMNEGIYLYIFRTIPQSMLRCWEMEATRIRNRGLSFWPGLLENRMVPYAVGQIVLLLALYLFSGFWGLLFYLGHIVVAHVVLESVNYIQHYGLMRKQHDGEYEDTAAEHSWDTYHFFSSYVSFRVGHHSYHHLSSKPYYLLATEPKAPKLPVGYFWAITVVLIPPWWRHVMNPRLEPQAAWSKSESPQQVGAS